LGSAARTRATTRDIGLEAGAVVHVGNVAQVDHRIVDHFYRYVVELLHGLRAAVQGDVVLASADLRRALGHDQVLRVNRGHDFSP
jgi:hypothetical protein